MSSLDQYWAGIKNVFGYHSVINRLSQFQSVSDTLIEPLIIGSHLYENQMNENRIKKHFIY